MFLFFYKVVWEVLVGVFEDCIFIGFIVFEGYECLVFMIIIEEWVLIGD